MATTRELRDRISLGRAVRELLRTAGFVEVETRQDLELRDRISLGRVA